MNDIGYLTREGEYLIGFGYIVLPANMDREAYIEYVNKTGSCVIETEYGNYAYDVAVPLNLINYLKFPKSVQADSQADRYGSLVSWAKTPRYGKTFITNLFHKSNQMSFAGEFERVDILQRGGSIISENGIIDGVEVSKVTSVVTQSSEEIATHELKTSSPEGSAAYRQNSRGEILEHADSFKKVTALSSIEFSVEEGDTILAFLKLLKDKEIILDSESIKIGSGETTEVLVDADKIEVGSEETAEVLVDADKIEVGSQLLQPAVKGDTLVDILDQLITAIRLITVNTLGGDVSIAPLINDAQFQVIAQALNTIKSQKVSVE